MHLFRLTQPHPYLKPIQRWYEDAFPVDERRFFPTLLTMLSRPEMHLCALLNESQVVGFVVYWRLNDLIFIEHLAIDPDQRGQHYGQQALQHLLSLPGRYHVLEVEPPSDSLRQRRVRFYERAGFKVAPFPYQQPPYRPDGAPVPMYLMASPAILTETEFSQLTTLLRTAVYAP